MNVEDVQFIGRSMGPVSCFLNVDECGDLKQGGKEFIRMGLCIISVMQSVMVETNYGCLVKEQEASSG